MRGGWTAIRRALSLNYGQKVYLLATLPLVVAATAIAILVANQSRALAEREIEVLEDQLIAAKKEELRNYISLARTAFGFIYGNALPDDEAAKTEVAQILAAMLYGQDGYFFVYDYEGTNLVAPRQTWLINRNWAGLGDPEGQPVVDELIRIARQGGGYHAYVWPKPSTGEETQMVSYVVGLQDWRWAIGTGVFLDDVLESVATARAETEARIARTFGWIAAIALGAVLFVFASGTAITVRERRLADAKLKQLTQRIVDTQEEERGRVARELHDSISQLLVGVRYALELARRRLSLGDARAAESLSTGIEHLSGAIAEVRRISRDLRPGVLDDLGLGPALQVLMEEFGKRTGIATEFETVVFRNRLDQDAKIALYRIAQEALTNVEKHAGATKVKLVVRGHKRGAMMRIEDDGRGMAPMRADDGGGLGLRNMAERMEQLDGTLRILSSRDGTVIEAQVPLSHMLPPAGQAAKRKDSA
ncbi:cache domain-containing protein [Defluviimonas sp. WL0024]|uniref:histidine kinase n=2 Tax=Albidovulum TaxID=205889 RepID=A0ABT3J194_9RHOB|nr:MULTISPECIES: cache domain-containing protein [Defluviimonas]MCU9846936.1 cache domain-containing protein [Defluviimonas sp. WL0024]MCW3781194.1 cache domain-containing protein [Defluviimonas salinarum]